MAFSNSKHAILSQNAQNSSNNIQNAAVAGLGETPEQKIQRVIENRPELRGIYSSFDPPYQAMLLYVLQRVTNYSTDDEVVQYFMDARDVLSRRLGVLATPVNPYLSLEHFGNGILGSNYFTNHYRIFLPLVTGGITFLIAKLSTITTNQSLATGAYIGLTTLLYELNNFGVKLDISDYDSIDTAITSLVGSLVVGLAALGITLGLDIFVKSETGLSIPASLFVPVAMGVSIIVLVWIYIIKKVYDSVEPIVETVIEDVASILNFL